MEHGKIIFQAIIFRFFVNLPVCRWIILFRKPSIQAVAHQRLQAAIEGVDNCREGLVKSNLAMVNIPTFG